ncbi:MAG: hypothetical protein OEU46_09090 [Alphaproteobacteria bacterium]|nr:hypothetical protein [Alphaproteobacteria bacterium]
MFRFYDLVVAAQQAERFQSAGYQFSQSVSAEIRRETIAQAITEQRRIDKEDKQRARRISLAVLWNRVQSVFQYRTTIAE